MPRKLLVWGEKNFSIEIPDDAKVTFGPFSPPSAAAAAKGSYGGPSRVGTLRVYRGSKTTENVIAVFSGVEGFREDSLAFEEEAIPEPTAAITEVLVFSELTEEQREELASLVAGQLAERAMEKDEDEV